jgi:hypothetical protein
MTDYSKRYSRRASLAAVGIQMRRWRIWETVGEHVRIKQKVIRHTPLDKLLDAFINILAGGQGLVETNKNVRADPGLQRAFGRERCAEQSTVSDTINASTEENVGQMRQAVTEVYRTYGQGYRHSYQAHLQLLDVDMTGMPAGRTGEGVEKGFFSGKRNRRGRQLGRVTATLYDEVVVDRLYPGKRQMERSLQELVTAAEEVLGLDESHRKRTIIRVDGGGGRDADVNWLLNRGYHVVVKNKNWKRANVLAASVSEWHVDPKTGDREVGWIENPHLYVKPTRQVAIRTPKKDGSWLYWVLISTLSDEELFWLARQPFRKEPALTQIMFALLYAYDLRSGGVETSIKGSKQGLGLTQRNKKRFAAQEMLVLLAQLAYNLVVWVRNLLAKQSPKLSGFGLARMIRDIFQIDGSLCWDAQGRILAIMLNKHDPFTKHFISGLAPVWPMHEMYPNLGQT